jgi:hypothetical protein
MESRKGSNVMFKLERIHDHDEHTWICVEKFEIRSETLKAWRRTPNFSTHRVIEEIATYDYE